MTPGPPSSDDPVDPARVPEPDPWRALRHDLRTPLNQIIGYSEMLIETLGETAPEALKGDLLRLHASGAAVWAAIETALSPERTALAAPDLPTLRDELARPVNGLLGQRDLCHQTARNHALSDVVADLEKIGLAAGNLRALLDGDRFRGGPSPEPPLAAPGFSSPSAAAAPPSGTLLVVDDEPLNREMLMRRLDRLGYAVAGAENGRAALELLAGRAFDLVLLDILMPELDGILTLERIKADPALQHIPVVMLTSLDDAASTVRCIEAGADDYVPKPFNPVILQARLGAALAKKRLRDHERAHVAELQAERARSESLLQSILPRAVCERLRNGEPMVVDAVQEATVLFADIVGFTRIASTMAPGRTVALLSEVFSDFDHLAERMGVEKIKTIGDAFMAVSGVPVPERQHAMLCADMALHMLDIIDNFNRRNHLRWSVRIGIHTGPVVAGIIGFRKFAYDLWGDTVNIANRLESHGEPGIPQVSASTAERISTRYLLEQRGLIELKNRGEIMAYRLLGRAPA